MENGNIAIMETLARFGVHLRYINEQPSAPSHLLVNHLRTARTTASQELNPGEHNPPPIKVGKQE